MDIYIMVSGEQRGSVPLLPGLLSFFDFVTVMENQVLADFLAGVFPTNEPDPSIFSLLN
jgi:hypothetical protein